MTDIKLGTNIMCKDSPCGKTSNIVIVRAARKVSHILVEDQKFPGETTHLFPITKVTNTTPKQITLNCSEAEQKYQKFDFGLPFYIIPVDVSQF